MEHLPTIGSTVVFTANEPGFPRLMNGVVNDIWDPSWEDRPDWVAPYADVPLVQIKTPEHGIWISMLIGLERGLPDRSSPVGVESWLAQ